MMEAPEHCLVMLFDLRASDMEKAPYLPRFVEKLKETFVGCDIIIDPLKTYLIIDWS